jgi:hypothetical protein
MNDEGRLVPWGPPRAVVERACAMASERFVRTARLVKDAICEQRLACASLVEFVGQFPTERDVVEKVAAGLCYAHFPNGHGWADLDEDSREPYRRMAREAVDMVRLYWVDGSDAAIAEVIERRHAGAA